jgi:hypothetical protein
VSLYETLGRDSVGKPPLPPFSARTADISRIRYRIYVGLFVSVYLRTTFERKFNSQYQPRGAPDHLHERKPYSDSVEGRSEDSEPKAYRFNG